ncbi:MAG: flagellar biosynthesis protein FlhA, partial [Oscillospiraceae bacterium]
MKKLNLLNNMVSLVVVAIILMLIIPLDPMFLDMMFVLNLAISFIILFTTMYIKEPLEFSIFPSILLITTVMRMSLTVSSTRSILLKNGYAGEVIKVFGEFVIQGNVVVGLLIFMIIVIVQFAVITKGAERVAEVSARFTLDAMPGKQMAIDADLNSGLIDEMQARERRLKIQREADFFGAMDGASKFVKGDAVISIIVTFINLIGGVVMGFINKQGTFAEIIQIYCTATVGDGLMSQVPALLISMSMGMIVTRSASGANLNKDVLKQFLSQPMVLVLAGAVMSTLIFIGFPVVQVLIVSTVLISIGLGLMKKQKQALSDETAASEMQATEEVTSEVSYYKNIDNVYGLLNVEQVEMEFGYSLIPLVDEASGGSFMDRVVMFRKQFALEMGMVLPSVRLKDSGALNPNQYSIKFKGEQVALGDVLMDHFLA